MSVITTSYAQNDWIWQNPFPTNNQLHGVYFIDSNTGWAVEASGTVLYTIDGSENWIDQSYNTSKPLESVFFISKDSG